MLRIGLLGAMFAAAAAPAGALASGPAIVSAPTSAHVGSTVTVRAVGLTAGRYALTVVSDTHPRHNASCVARLSTLVAEQGGSVTLHGSIPARLYCYQGASTHLGRVATVAGSYHLIVAQPNGPDGFNGSASFVRAPLRITRY